jgi:hypothetical protein
VEFYCAGCGCLVERGVRLIPCEGPECCCFELPVVEPMAVLAARIRTSLNARDIDSFRSLIAEDARWGDDPDHPRTCHNRNDIIATYKQLLDQGVRGRVVETTTGSRGVACLLEVEWPDTEQNDRGPSFYQVFLVEDGLIARIEGHDDEDMALAAIST